ncbi:Disease resistance protein RML1A [Linum perenne]
MDDKKLPRGETIKTSMSTAIERSRLSVVVFSSGYADSKWCLDELCQDRSMCKEE